MDVSKTIRRLRAGANLTQEDMAARLDVNRSTIAQWESGYSTPRLKMIEKIANLFSVPTSYLLGDTGATDIPDNALLPDPSPRRAYAPLLGRVHAGDAVEPDILDDRIPVPADLMDAHPHAYFLEVEGQCMSRVYPEGCYILIDPDAEPTNGSIAVVSIDGSDYVMRRLYRGASVLVLSPDSWEDGFEDIVVTGDTAPNDLNQTLIGRFPDMSRFLRPCVANTVAKTGMRKAPARRRGHLVSLLLERLGSVLDVHHLDLGRLRHLLSRDLREPGGGLLGRDRLH